MADETKRLCTCAICSRLFRKATTLRNCNHIFCWKWIYGKITKHDWKCCPVCYVELGPDPLIKLRRDHPILKSLRTKGLFPAEMDVEMSFETSDDEETDESEHSDYEETLSEYSDEEETDESEDSEDEELVIEISDEEETDESEDEEDEELVIEISNDEESEYETSDDETTDSYNSSDDEDVPLAMDTESEADSD